LRIRPTDAAVIPLPRPLITPPVTKMYFTRSPLDRKVGALEQ